MKKVAGILILYFLCVVSLSAQDYLQVVEYESTRGNNAIFTSAGQAVKKKELEVNAIKSLFHTLFFQGVEGINNGKPLVSKPKPMYTNSFFDRQARYIPYVVSVDEASKLTKTGGLMQGTMRITIRINQLINDVKTNIGGDISRQTGTVVSKPTIIVVPFKKEGENYKNILDNNDDYRIAVGAVQKGFENADIKTVDLGGRLEGGIITGVYEENAGAADSNDRQLLLRSGADVYVTVDLMKDVTPSETRLDLQLKAYEITSGALWGSENGWAKSSGKRAIEELCFHAMKEHLPAFLDQIVKNYSSPVRSAIHISLSGSSVGTLLDTDCSNGENVMEFIENWLNENAYESQYNVRGIVAESAVIEDVMIPRQDRNRRRMTTSKFATMLNRELKDNGISGTVRIDGNSILLMLNL